MMLGEELPLIVPLSANVVDEVGVTGVFTVSSKGFEGVGVGVGAGVGGGAVLPAGAYSARMAALSPAAKVEAMR